MSTIGVAMIARNSAETMRAALDPFMGIVDEMTIVMGGESYDNTADIAHDYADTIIGCGNLDLDEAGRLLDFSQARNIGIKALNTDWVIVVDTDDEWGGVEKLPEALPSLERHNIVLVPYKLQNYSFPQARILKRLDGRFVSPIHEQWETYGDPRFGMAKFLTLRQVEKPYEVKLERLTQNLQIGESILRADGDSARVLSGLAQGYYKANKFTESLQCSDRYLALNEPNNPDEWFGVEMVRGMCHLRLKDYEAALLDGARALGVADYGQAWTLISEATFMMASQSHSDKGLSQLSVFCADQALETGYKMSSIPLSKEQVTIAPLQLKTQALCLQGKLQAAKATASLGLMLSPGNKIMNEAIEAIEAVKNGG